MTANASVGDAARVGRGDKAWRALDAIARELNGTSPEVLAREVSRRAMQVAKTVGVRALDRLVGKLAGRPVDTAPRALPRTTSGRVREAVVIDVAARSQRPSAAVREASPAKASSPERASSRARESSPLEAPRSVERAAARPRVEAQATRIEEAAAVETAPVAAAPVEAAPRLAAPVGAAPIEAALGEAATAEATQVEAAQVAAAPVVAAPAEAAPVVAAPVEAAPVVAAPVEAAPVEAATPAPGAAPQNTPEDAGPTMVAPRADQPLPALPPRFGIDRVVLVAGDSEYVFAYWETDPARVAAAARAELRLLAEGGALVGRAYVDPVQGRQHLRVPARGRRYYAELVLLDGSATGQTLSRSRDVVVRGPETA